MIMARVSVDTIREYISKDIVGQGNQAGLSGLAFILNGICDNIHDIPEILIFATDSDIDNLFN